MLYVDEQTQLVRALFGCATAPAAKGAHWSAFLQALQKLTRADGVSLCIAQGKTGANRWSVGAPPDIASSAMEALRFHRVYEQSELAGPEESEGFLRLIKVRTGADAYAGLALSRAPSSFDFRAIDGQNLTLVAGFLGQAATIWATLAEERAFAQLEARLGQRLGAGWIAFDMAGQITHLSALAQDWGGQAGLSFAQRRTFEPADPALASAFWRAFSACITTGERQVIVLAAEPFVEMVLQRETAAPRMEVMGYLRRTGCFGTLPRDALAAHFGLSRSEAKLAALLCDGRSLRDAASDLGWTIETARSCSKVIFARLGVHGQPALVRRLLTSAVELVHQSQDLGA